MVHYEFFLTHSLEKVFPDCMPETWKTDWNLEGFRNEVVSFQLVYTALDGERGMPQQRFRIQVSGAEARMRKVGLVPSDYPCYAEYDTNYITTKAGMFPDVLLPFDGMVIPVPGQMRSLWIDIDLRNLEAGNHEITITAEAEEVTTCANGVIIHNPHAVEQNWKQTLQLQVLPAVLPEQRLLHTEWFHADCLADYYKVEAFSEEHWKIVENYIRFAGEECGVNLLLTPVFTQPLDTAVGGDRTAVQLVEVIRKEGQYRFGFGQLERWCKLCRKYGIENLEIAHFFTQWGAHATPKIIAETDNGMEQIFGWEVEAVSPEYRHFLESFVPALLGKLADLGYEKNQLFFHISDEPGEEHLESYLTAKKQVTDLLEGYIIVDALSSYEFYKQGIVEHPIPADDHIQPFIDHGVEDLWVYYCCVQCVDVPNRFYAMPSARNRIMGVLMYLYRIRGFLHWGYNFYNSAFSLRHINPYAETHAGYAFPSGDPYLVYPGEGGSVVSSIRNQVQMEALYDLRAMELLESLSDRETVESLILEGEKEKMTFKSYPSSSHYLFKLRRKINREIIKRIS